jgi:hypothetical protein
MTTTTVREKPILFSGPMVRAILDGKKTQTRRVVKPQPAPGELIKKTKASMIPDAAHLADDLFDAGVRLDLPPHCPYGQPGDRLRISEEVTITAYERNAYEVLYHADRSVVVRYGWPELMTKIRAYKDPHLRGVHLPPAYARDLRLEITNIRVERLQEISEADAQAEGVEPGCLTCGENCIDRGGCGCCRPAYRDSFACLWMELYGRESWSANPWVFVVDFRRIDQ